MKKVVLSGMMLLACATANAGQTTDAVIGGAIGGAAGAAIGSQVGGRQGAIIGAGIGGATGAAVATSGDSRQSSSSRQVVYAQDDYGHHPNGHAYGYYKNKPRGDDYYNKGKGHGHGHDD